MVILAHIWIASRISYRYRRPTSCFACCFHVHDDAIQQYVYLPNTDPVNIQILYSNCLA